MERSNLVVEDAKIIYRNLAGVEKRFNPAGVRNFLLILDDDVAVKLIEDGWNVKYLSAREDVEGDEPRPYIKVGVTFDNFPPRVYMITSLSKRRTLLTEETIGAVDYAQIQTVDLTVRPYFWQVGDKTGIKAYLKTMYVTVEEDELDYKYADEDE